MYLASMIHRERLFRIVLRWFGDRVEPGDGRFVTELFLYEFVVSGGTVRRFVGDILQSVSADAPRLRRFLLKDELRRAIVEAAVNPVPRVQELFRLFAQRPEEFFPRTPTNLVVATRADGRLAGMIRFKSIRRLAEKASRRIADRLAAEIRGTALALAETRARTAGVPLAQLVSSPDQMAEEFAAAERIVSHSFKDQRLVLEPHHMRIDDMIGIKFVGTPEELLRIERAVRSHPCAQVVERQVHEGSYCDVQLLVELQLPPVADIIAAQRTRDWSQAAGRGLSAQELADDFPGFVESGARTFRCEIILTTFDELVESEFGRSMHEERIIQQRTAAPYRGRIARNASYLVEYLLMLAISPTTEISALPVKMWGRYLEDAFSAAIWMLFGVPYRQGLTGALELEIGRELDRLNV